MKKNGLRYNFREKNMLKIAGQNKRHITFPSVSSIHTVGIIADFSMKPDFVLDNFSQKLEIDLVETRSEKRLKGDSSMAIYASDLNFWGIPPKHLIQSFVDKPFDILINFTVNKNEVVDYICALSLAKFKVSKQQHYTIYDLIINKANINDADYLREIIKTLSNFSN